MKNKKLKLKKGEFKIETREGKKTVNGLKNDFVGIHKEEDWWKVTHIPSGFLVGKFGKKKKARIIAETFYDLYNGITAADEITKDRKKGRLFYNYMQYVKKFIGKEDLFSFKVWKKKKGED